MIDFIEESELAGFLPGVFGVMENASFDQSSMNVGDLIEKNNKKGIPCCRCSAKSRVGSEFFRSARRFLSENSINFRCPR